MLYKLFSFAQGLYPKHRRLAVFLYEFWYRLYNFRNTFLGRLLDKHGNAQTRIYLFFVRFGKLHHYEICQDRISEGYWGPFRMHYSWNKGFTLFVFNKLIYKKENA